MTESKPVVTAKSPQPSVQATAQQPPQATVQAAVDSIKIPKEIGSMNSGIRVIIDGGSIQIELNPTIAEEIGAYRRCKVTVRFQENGPVSVIPELK